MHPYLPVSIYTSEKISNHVEHVLFCYFLPFPNKSSRELCRSSPVVRAASEFASVVVLSGAMENRRGLGVEARPNSGREVAVVSLEPSSRPDVAGGRVNRDMRGLSEAGLNMKLRSFPTKVWHLCVQITNQKIFAITFHVTIAP
jgi:hypothetical protein